MSGAAVGVGVDVVEVARVRRAVERSPGFLERVFTDEERRRCTTPSGALRFEGLAARFAAKEAVAKALGTGVRGFALVDVEVRTGRAGAPCVALHRGAAAIAERVGIAGVLLSLSHTAGVAVAAAVAVAPAPATRDAAPSH